MTTKVAHERVDAITGTRIEPIYWWAAVGNEADLFTAAWQQKLPVLLKGPTGVGKTRFVEHMAMRYKDGTYDAGHFMLGHDRLGMALLTNEKQKLTLSTDVTGEITQVSDGP